MKRVLFVLLFLLPILGSATNFIVTNNSSSGNGSLSQAVYYASQNGTSTTDTISFNLPVSKTTIIITSPLVLSSNLIIDGTTQPGNAFGLTDTKVRVKAMGCVSGLLLDGVSKIEIYGLWFTDFNSGTLSCLGSAISIRNTSNFTLGKPGKGNCFTNNRTSIVYPWQLSLDSTENVGITIQSNRFGMDTLLAPDEYSSNLAFGATRKFLFGGNKAEEGNRIGNAFVTVGNFYIPLSAKGDTIAFKNNLFGFDAYNGSLISTIGIYVAGYIMTGSELNVIISNNKIGKDDATNKIWLTDITGNILIHDNYIGSLNSVVTPGEIASGMYLENCVKKDSIIIRNNTINGYKHAILINSSKDITISNNSIYCNAKGISYNRIDVIPIVSLLALTSTYLKGTTQPLSTVEIFSTNVCNQYCENGRQLLATVKADSQGIFEYNGTLAGSISVTATSPSGTTSEFYGAKFTVANVVFKDATCGLKNGYIKGIQVIKGNSFHWEDEGGNVVGTDTSVYNLGTGKYRFYVKDSLSSCPVYSSFFELKSIPKPFVDSNFSTLNTSCSKSMGQIILNGVRSTGSISIWQDSAFNTLQVDGDSIVHLAPGTYNYRLALLEDSLCYTSYGPFKIADKPGPVLQTQNLVIRPSNCGGATGSITNIKVGNTVGNVLYRWEDSTGTVVASTLDLTNVPGGKYRLKFKDSTFCDTLVTAFYTIERKGGIAIDSSNRVIRASGCTANTGSITGLTVAGAEYMEWINVATSQKIGNQANLLQVPFGYYRLNAGNAVGCKDTSTVMFVPQAAFAPITVQRIEQIQPHCDLANGSLKITEFSSDSTRYIFTWKDSLSGVVLSNHSLLSNVNPGIYYLNAVDSNGCAAKLVSTIMKQVGKPVIDLSKMKLQHDTCNQSNGFINNILVNGGQKPYSWQWYLNPNNAAISNNPNSIANLKKGSYKLKISDAYSCATTSNDIVIADYDKQLPAPIADNLTIPRNTTGDIIIKNFTPGTYSLFDTITASLPFRISNRSRLATPVVGYNKTFYIQYTLGNCLSPLQQVMVTVFDQSKLVLPNAFSPNGDGINDVWKMQVQGLISIKEWLVFNRYGQLIFSSKNGSAGWDGKVKNAYVPVGTYYWIVNATDNNGKEIIKQGSVTVLR